MLEALEHRLWFVCEEMYNQTYTFDTYCGNHMLVDDKDNTLVYVARPSLGVANNATYLRNGASDNGLTIIFRLSWTNSNGATVSMDVQCSDEDIRDIYAQGSTLAFWLTATGADRVDGLTVATIVRSNTGVVVKSEALNYTGAN